MEQIAIGKSGLKVSRIGLGTWAIGGALALELWRWQSQQFAKQRRAAHIR